MCIRSINYTSIKKLKLKKKNLQVNINLPYSTLCQLSSVLTWPLMSNAVGIEGCISGGKSHICLCPLVCQPPWLWWMLFFNRSLVLGTWRRWLWPRLGILICRQSFLTLLLPFWCVYINKLLSASSFSTSHPWKSAWREETHHHLLISIFQTPRPWDHK